MKLKLKLFDIITVLTALLCFLKLFGILSISWIWCFSLIWLPIVTFILLLFIVIFIIFIVSLIEVIFKL
jgi:hypothetical protein